MARGCCRFFGEKLSGSGTTQSPDENEERRKTPSAILNFPPDSSRPLISRRVVIIEGNSGEDQFVVAPELWPDNCRLLEGLGYLPGREGTWKVIFSIKCNGQTGEMETNGEKRFSGELLENLVKLWKEGKAEKRDGASDSVGTCKGNTTGDS
jgi:hypothetical protein